MMKRIFTLCVLLAIALSLAGCWHTPKTISYNDKKMMDDSKGGSEKVTVGDDDQVRISQETPDQPEEMGKNTEEVDTPPAGPESTTLSKDEGSDCAGRLVAKYNQFGEQTGYQCLEDPALYECPGHRAGETWTEDNGDTCTCLDNGTVRCESKERIR